MDTLYVIQFCVHVESFIGQGKPFCRSSDGKGIFTVRRRGVPCEKSFSLSCDGKNFGGGRGGEKRGVSG